MQTPGGVQALPFALEETKHVGKIRCNALAGALCLSKSNMGRIAAKENIIARRMLKRRERVLDSNCRSEKGQILAKQMAFLKRQNGDPFNVLPLILGQGRKFKRPATPCDDNYYDYQEDEKIPEAYQILLEKRKVRYTSSKSLYGDDEEHANSQEDEPPRRSTISLDLPVSMVRATTAGNPCQEFGSRESVKPRDVKTAMTSDRGSRESLLPDRKKRVQTALTYMENGTSHWSESVDNLRRRSLKHMEGDFGGDDNEIVFSSKPNLPEIKPSKFDLKKSVVLNDLSPEEERKEARWAQVRERTVRRLVRERQVQQEILVGRAKARGESKRFLFSRYKPPKTARSAT